MKQLRGVAAAVLCLTAVPVSAQPASSLPADQLLRIETMIEQQQARLGIPGLTVAVALEGQIRYSKAFGKADLENTVAADTTTLFRTASIAKPITATALMQLVEAGRLELDAPVQKYCPAWSEKPWPVTARQLLGHLAGVRHYEKTRESSGTEHFFSIADSLRLFKEDPLKHEPGTKYHYSTFGYSVLGCAAEGASGLPFDQLVEERVFRPAGMSRSTLDHHFRLVSGRARGYMRVTAELLRQLPESARRFAREGEALNAQLHDTSMKVPGGGLLSTSEDLVRFALALQAGKLVKPETREQMWTSLKTRDGAATGYGLGWNVPPSEAGQLVLHTGGQAGTSTVLLIRRDRNLAVAVMMNLDDVAARRFAAAIGEIVTGAKVAP